MTRSVALLWFVVSAVRLAGQESTDSAGVRLWRYSHQSGALEEWRVDPVPLLRIAGGDAEGPFEFTGVEGVMRTSTGEVVADGGTLCQQGAECPVDGVTDSPVRDPVERPMGLTLV